MSGNRKKSKEDRLARRRRKRSKLRKGERKVTFKLKPKTTQEEKVRKQRIMEE